MLSKCFFYIKNRCSDFDTQREKNISNNTKIKFVILWYAIGTVDEKERMISDTLLLNFSVRNVSSATKLPPTKNTNYQLNYKGRRHFVKL